MAEGTCNCTARASTQHFFPIIYQQAALLLSVIMCAVWAVHAFEQ